MADKDCLLSYNNYGLTFEEHCDFSCIEWHTDTDII